MTWSSGELWWCYVPGARVYISRRRHWRGYKEYTKADIDRAIELVHNGASLIEAEKATRVPDSSIRRFLKKCTAHPGPCKGASLRQGPFLQSAQSAEPFSTVPSSSGEKALQSWVNGSTAYQSAVSSRACFSGAKALQPWVNSRVPSTKVQLVHVLAPRGSPDVILCGWLGSKHQLTN